MTNLWSKIKELFQPEQEDDDEDIDLSYPVELALDEKFAKFFSEAGGHFLYCENKQEVLYYLKQIIEQEHISRFICFEEPLQKMLTMVGANYINYPSATADFNFIHCESLISYNGSIMLSSDKTGGRKISELPDNFIVYAQHSQIVDNLSEAMQILNRTKMNNLPSGITSIGGVDANPMNGKISTKNIYLLIVE